MRCVCLKSFGVNDLIFGEPKIGKLRNGKDCKKIPIKVKHQDGAEGVLAFATEPCFSFGVQRDKKYDSYVLPVALCDMNNPTEGQKLMVRSIRDIQSACDPEPKSCLYGDEDSPKLYLKLMHDKDNDKILTRLYEREDVRVKSSGEMLDPKKFLNKFCDVRVVFVIESLFTIDTTTTLRIRTHKVILSILQPRTQGFCLPDFGRQTNSVIRVGRESGKNVLTA